MSNQEPDSRNKIPNWLQELRSLMRTSLALRGLSLAIASLALIFFLSIGVDRLFRLSHSGRAVSIALCLGLLLWITWTYLIKPLITGLPDRILGDLLEKKFPQLGDTLRSAIDFRRSVKNTNPEWLDDRQRLTYAMKARVIEQAGENLGQLEREKVVDSSVLLKSASLGLTGLILVTLFAAFFPQPFKIWYQRHLLFADTEWPYRTELVVEGFASDTMLVPRGDPLDIRVSYIGEDPTQVSLRMFYENESTRYNLPREGDRVFVHNHAAVTEAFRFRVSGGDYRSQFYNVVPQERPSVEELAVKISPPAYTGKKPEETQGELGELAAPEGSKLSVRGRSNKELARAWLTTENREIELEVTGKEFSGSYDPKFGGAVTVNLEDSERVPPDHLLQFSVHLLKDRLPKVQLKVNGLGPLISAQARMPLEIEGKDDYSIEKLHLSWEVVDENNESKKGDSALPDLEETGADIYEEPVWEVSSLNLVPEKRLNIRIGATDNDGIQGAKTGFSATKSYLVVSLERLGEEFVRREEEQRRMLERLLEREKEVRDAVFEMVSGEWNKSGDLADPIVKKMLALARIERQHARQCAAIGDAVEQILAEMKNNRVGEADHLQRLATLIIDPLRLLAEISMPASAVGLGKIRDTKIAQDRVSRGLELAADIEEQIATLERVIAQMAKLENFTEIVKFLRVIISTQEASMNAAEKNLEREVDNLFDDESEGSFDQERDE